MWDSLTETVRMMALSQALNQKKKKRKRKRLDLSELKPLIFLEMNYFLFIKKGKKDKEVKNVIICRRKNYMAISVSQAYLQGIDQNSDTLPDFGVSHQRCLCCLFTFQHFLSEVFF